MSLVTQLYLPISVSLLGSAPDFVISPISTILSTVVVPSSTGVGMNSTGASYDPQQVSTTIIAGSAWSPSGTYLCLLHSTLGSKYSLWKRNGCRLDLITTAPAFVGTEARTNKPVWADGDNMLIIAATDATNPLFVLTRSGDTFTRITGVLDFNPVSSIDGMAINADSTRLLLLGAWTNTGVNHTMTMYTRTPATNNWVRSDRKEMVSSTYNASRAAFRDNSSTEIAIYAGGTTGSDRTLIQIWTESAGVMTLSKNQIGVVSAAVAGTASDLIYAISGKYLYYTKGTGTGSIVFQAWDASNSYATITHGWPSTRLSERLSIGSNPNWLLASGSSTAVNDYMALYSINSSTGALTTLDRWEVPGSNSGIIAPGANFAYGTSYADQIALLYNQDPLITGDGAQTQLRFNETSGTTIYNLTTGGQVTCTISGTGFSLNQAGPVGGTEGPTWGLNRAITFTGTVAAQDRIVTLGSASWQSTASSIATGVAAMVVKVQTPIGAKGTLWAQGQNTGTNKGLFALNVYGSNGELEVMMRAGSVLGERARRFTGFSILDGNFHNICVTQLGDGNGVRLWVDGVEKTAFTDTTSGTVPSLAFWLNNTGGSGAIGVIMGTPDIAVLPNHEGKGTVAYFAVANTTVTSKLGLAAMKALDDTLTF